MNIVYLHCHDAGRYVSPYGYAIPTPSLQKFAVEGTLFRKAFCCGPTCSPSRAALLTGESPHESGMLGLAHRGFSLSHPERHLASYLSANGYLTALSGIQHEFGGGVPLPYDRHLQEEGSDENTAKAAAAFLAEEHDRPFFLSCGFFAPHRPFPDDPDPDIDLRFLQVPTPLPDDPVTRRDAACYMTAVRNMDAALGIVLEALTDSGRIKDSLVIITTDHGPAFPQMKCQLFDDGIGVLLLMDFPGNPSAGTTVDALVSHLDVFPTICDLAGLPLPVWLEGKSIRPVLEGSVPEINAEIFSEVSYHAGYEPQRCIRTLRYKLIMHFEEGSHPHPVNVDDCPSKELLRDAGLFSRLRPEIQLYDLLLDPHERCNLVEDPEFRFVRKELEDRLHLWMKTTNDPLLKGLIPPPPGAKVNPRGQYSPREEPVIY